MPVELVCPGCRKPLRAHDGLLGSDALCPYCRNVVKVPAAATAVSAAMPESPTPPPDLADDDEAPLMPPSFDFVEENTAAPAEPESLDEVMFEVDKPAVPQPAPEPAQPAQQPAPAAEKMWWAQTADGQQYGPVPKSELDSWVADGSINAQCQVLRDGDEAWQWASQVYPQLS